MALVGSAIATSRSQQRVQQQQQAWHWWYSQQQQQQQYQAEIVRDGLLQEAFALRRCLENGSSNTPVPLEQFNQFYRALENLSNQLSPPFIEDSLPLALQFLLKHYGQLETALTLEPDTDWSSDKSESNQTVVAVVAELLPLLAQAAQPPLQVRLWRSGSLNNLRFTRHILHQQTARSLLNSVEVEHLKEIFHSLLSGTLDIKQTNAELMCQLSWRVAPVK
ncbi:MAG: hypothetical protein AAF808_08880 [Cyanobacteria bacterium P01_D01_bin.2]